MRTRNYCCRNLNVFTKNKYFTVGIANVNKQSGDNDYGLFAAAYITSIAHGQDPSSIVYNQGLMREHLLSLRLKEWPYFRLSGREECFNQRL